ncbi:hypothetical protein AB0442_38670 [Kitasatospora sp. NPDC085895]
MDEQERAVHVDHRHRGESALDEDEGMALVGGEPGAYGVVVL